MKAAFPVAVLACSAPLLIANGEPAVDPVPDAFERAPLMASPEAVAGLETLGQCTDTWHRVREERDPPMRREHADPDQPILFKAVDHQIDGCDFLLVGDGDIRPLPLPQDRQLRPQPAQ